MNGVELSIIVPVKDEVDAIAPFIAQVGAVIEALDDPASKSYELLFIDDGSTDGTFEAIRAAKAANPHVRAISAAMRSRPCHTRSVEPSS